MKNKRLGKDMPGPGVQDFIGWHVDEFKSTKIISMLNGWNSNKAKTQNLKRFLIESMSECGQIQEISFHKPDEICNFHPDEVTYIPNYGFILEVFDKNTGEQLFIEEVSFDQIFMIRLLLKKNGSEWQVS